MEITLRHFGCRIIQVKRSTRYGRPRCSWSDESLNRPSGWRKAFHRRHGKHEGPWGTKPDPNGQKSGPETDPAHSGYGNEKCHRGLPVSGSKGFYGAITHRIAPLSTVSIELLRLFSLLSLIAYERSVKVAGRCVINIFGQRRWFGRKIFQSGSLPCKSVPR